MTMADSEEGGVVCPSQYGRGRSMYGLDRSFNPEEQVDLSSYSSVITEKIRRMDKPRNTGMHPLRPSLRYNPVQLHLCWQILRVEMMMSDQSIRLPCRAFRWILHSY